MYLTRFLDSVIMPYYDYNGTALPEVCLESSKKDVQEAIAFFGNEYQVTEAKILPQGFDSNLIKTKCVLVSFYPKLRFVNRFQFSEFGNTFYTHKDTSIDFVREYCLNFLNSNYPKLAPFTLERIETKEGSKGTTGKNENLQSNAMLITFKPLINTKWD